METPRKLLCPSLLVGTPIRFASRLEQLRTQFNNLPTFFRDELGLDVFLRLDKRWRNRYVKLVKEIGDDEERLRDAARAAREHDHGRRVSPSGLDNQFAGGVSASSAAQRHR